MTYLRKPFVDVRTALTTTSNTTGGDARTSIGGVEIQKRIDSLIVDTINRSVDFKPLVNRRSMGQLSHVWNLRTDLGSTTKSAFFSEGGTGTPYPSSKIQLFAPAKALRSDYEVTNLMLAASTDYYNALEDEARDALSRLALVEEQAFVNGDDANVGVTGSYQGLYQLMGSYADLGDTDSIYGDTRVSGDTFLDVQTVAASTTSTGALSLQELDSAITKSNNQGGKGFRRIFLCSEERANAIAQLLQPQQRFMLNTGFKQTDGGFQILQYKGIPIIACRRMAYNGVTRDSSPTVTRTDVDQSMYLLDMDHIVFMTVAGVDTRHVPIIGDDTSIRKDVQGGYFKTYGVFVMKRFDTQVLIYNLTTL